MKKTLIILSLVFIMIGTSSCTRPDQSTQILSQQGYSNVKILPWRIWHKMSCGEDDYFSTRFEATAPDGNSIVNGVVCSGWFKGSTVRTF